MATKPSRRTSKPRQTAEEREAKVAALKAQLDDAVLGLNSPDTWEEFLTHVSNFGAQYSMNNQMLIWLGAQARGFEPTLVQSFTAWKKAAQQATGCRCGRFDKCTHDLNVPARPQGVSKDEPFGLPIWVPIKRKLSKEECDQREARGEKRIPRDEKGRSLYPQLVSFGIDYVFDRAQLKRPDEVSAPEPLIVRRRVRTNALSPQLLTGEDPTGALGDIIELIRAQGYTWELGEPCVPAANGITHFDTHRVVIRAGLAPAQIFKTTVHELAHILCGHGADDGFDYVAHRGQAETEAESVAFIVSHALGLDSTGYSAPYISAWSEGDEKLIRKCAETVLRVAKSVLEALEPAPESDDAHEATQARCDALVDA